MAKRKLGAVSTTALQVELKRRQSSLKGLKSRRTALSRELALVEKEIGSLGGAMAKAAPVRRKKKVAKKAGPVRRAKKKVVKKAAKKKVVARKATAKKGTGRRPKNKMTLVDAMKKVLAHKTLSVSEVAVAVQKVGYKTTSTTFRTIVNQTLLKNTQVFRKVARGQYTMAR